MRLSARNQLRGRIVKVEKGTTTAHVAVELPGGHRIVSSITSEAVDELALKAGDEAIVVIKASDVMIAKE